MGRGRERERESGGPGRAGSSSPPLAVWPLLRQIDPAGRFLDQVRENRSVRCSELCAFFSSCSLFIVNFLIWTDFPSPRLRKVSSIWVARSPRFGKRDIFVLTRMPISLPCFRFEILTNFYFFCSLVGFPLLRLFLFSRFFLLSDWFLLVWSVCESLFLAFYTFFLLLTITL